ncbi:ste ste20 mst protein kinase [Plasmopara halstedii]|uniref:Ste ste20 mst protein kinase n=1 Tax=Plasmopara halstedii TaxID=4781 RepID=A0A0N7L4T4_PLAHL|nr:ste ste20 mst protein kinase [Plasmopara halstedii]CEG39563.1 ste ste20 mst protein kinase [Plasmopara halstedii]|eukprot:XP_024575932.1 ste ste20 mst protein kinase [Plasmopara halstedii]
MAKSRRTSYAVTSAALPILKTLGLEEVDPEDVFELQRKEGAGAFGRVFQACYKNDRTRLAALKVIPVALEAGERGEDIENVRREIQFLRECNHPNVVAFHGAYYKDGALWVAMEYCAGGSVGDVRRARLFSEQEISVIMRGALCGLAYLHSRRKIHRDVKGGNILLTDSGQVKIADFGVSAQLRDTLSRRGSFVGTPYWMSPELIQDSNYDSKADIWSLGITAIELADQKPPLYDEHPMRVLIQIPRNPPPQVAQPEKWSTAFLDFLRFCLRKDPAERPTAVECMQHEFIRRQLHVGRVFARGDAVDKKTVNRQTIEEEFEEEIAEEVGAYDNASENMEDKGESAGLIKDTSELKKADMRIALQVSYPKKGDEVADPSTNESVALEKDLPAFSQVDNKQSHERVTPSKVQNTLNTPSCRQPPTELKLFPSPVKSPMNQSRITSTRFAKLDETSKKCGSDVSDAYTASDPIKPPVLFHPKTSISPPVSPSVHSSWLSKSSLSDDPLASIDTITSTRMNRLLSSLSTSTPTLNLAAAFQENNVQLVAKVSSRSAAQRQSFSWRSVEAALPAGSASIRTDSTRPSGKIFVGDPVQASHDVCVRFNSIQAQYEGAPLSAEWRALHQQFGIALVHMRCRSSTSHVEDLVPALIRMLRRELIRHGGLRFAFIYRVSPLQEDVQSAKAAINCGSLTPAHVSDPHVCASLLKLWLRELPTLLLDRLDVQDLTDLTNLTGSGNMDDDDDLQLITTRNIDIVDAQITRTLQKLEPREYAVLQWLLEHLLEVNEYRALNQMTTQALATVIAPNLYSCAGKAKKTHENAGNLIKQVVLFVRVLLSWRRGSPLTLLYEQEEENLAAAFTSKSPANDTNSSKLQQRDRHSEKENTTKVKADPEVDNDFVSLETALRAHVNRLWSDVEKSDITTVNTKRQEHVLRVVFNEFQESTLNLIARHTKRQEERTWALHLLDTRKTGQQLETTGLSSLKRMKDWVDAALSFEAFCRLLDREQTTQEKIDRLQAKLGFSPSCLSRESTTFSRNVFDNLSRLHDKHLFAKYMSCDKEVPTPNHDKYVSNSLHNGVVRLLSRRADHHNTVASLEDQNLAKIGESHPAIGNLLVLLGESKLKWDTESMLA